MRTELLSLLEVACYGIIVVTALLIAAWIYALHVQWQIANLRPKVSVSKWSDSKVQPTEPGGE